MRNISAIALTILLAVTSCTRGDLYVHYALKAAGDNRKELKTVLRHYRKEDPDKEKLKAAKYLIANMPGHYSYADTTAINSYYRTALSILGTGPSPDWQRDTLRQISDRDYPGLTRNIVSDAQIMTADYLIRNIDHAFTQWKTRPWAQHLTFEEFRDWILPYKVTELQSFDDWREVLSSYYSDSISTVPATDFERNSIYGAIEIVRNEIHSKQSDIGLRVIWEGQSGIPLRSAETWTHMTYGSCMDYVTMGTAVFRSLGLPAAVDMVPQWGRGNGGHSWYVFPTDRGTAAPTMNSLIVGADAEHVRNAFDGDWLTNFETENPDGNWVGMDFGKPVTVSHVRVVPRSDDNDICPGNEYELFQFDGNDWRSLGYRMAEGNTLHYDNIPLNTLLWMRNYTRGHDERPFVVKKNDVLNWW